MKNNKDEIGRSIAAYILKNAPVGLKDHNIKELKDIAEGNQEVDHFYLDFRQETAEGHTNDVYLSFRFQPVRPEDSVVSWVEDEEGNSWHEYEPVFQVSWPSYGSGSLTLTGERLRYIQQVYDFACDVRKGFDGPIHKLRYTKQELEEVQARKERRASEDTFLRIAASQKNMRVGTSRMVTPTDPSSMLPGDYEAEVNGKKFKAKLDPVGKDPIFRGVFYITRIA